MTTRIVFSLLAISGPSSAFPITLPCYSFVLQSPCFLFVFCFSRQEYVADGLILIEGFVARGDSIDT